MPRKLLYKWDNLPATLVCPCATRTLFLPRAGLEGAGRWDPFVKQTVEQQNEQIKQYIKSFYVWLFSLNQNRSFLPDSEWLNSPDSNNVYLLDFSLHINLTHHLDLYQVSVRTLECLATPLPSLISSRITACGLLEYSKLDEVLTYSKIT